MMGTYYCLLVPEHINKQFFVIEETYNPTGEGGMRDTKQDVMQLLQTMKMWVQGSIIILTDIY